MADDRDFYDILGVSRSASSDEIQKVYRKLAREFHPDLNSDPGAEARFKDIAEAYEVLSDPDLKRKYDTFGADFRQVPDDVDPEMWARAQRGRQTAGARQRAGGGIPPEWTVQYGDEGFDGDLGDIFGDIFGGGGRGRRGWGPIPGADQEVEITLSVEEAFTGGKRSIALSGAGGTRNLDVTIPPGVIDGQRIRLRGQGGQGSEGAQSGDLYLIVRLAKHDRYRVVGRDITVDLRLSPWEATLGASVPVDGPGGKATVKVRPGSSSGTKLRLKGRGMPNKKGPGGDLYAEVKIVCPTDLTDDERKLWEELRDSSTFNPRSAS